MPDRDLVLIAEIVSVHGVRGQVKIRHYCESMQSFQLIAPFITTGDKELSIKVTGSGDPAIASIVGVDSRDAAERLKGTKLYVPRSQLPPEDDNEFYMVDLVGMGCFLDDGAKFGEVVAIHNFGASDILEIKIQDSDETMMFAFTEETFPEVDLEAGKLIINPPEEV